MQPSITVIIPVYNGSGNFQQCLKGIAELDPSPTQVIVIDDGSTDASAQIAEQFGAQVISLPQSHGPGYARNIGAGAAEADLLFFVDADVVVKPDAVARIQQCFADQPNLTALIGSYDDAPAATNFASQFKNLMHHYVHQNSDSVASTFWGACGAIRRDVFLKVGGFDAERYPLPSIEDIEMGYRLTDAGHAIALVKDLQVKHLKRWTLYSQWHTDFFARALPWTTLLLSREMADDLNLRWSSRISTVLVFLLCTFVVAALFIPMLWLLVSACVIALLILNLPLYQFFWRKRGVSFTLFAVGWHWFYYLYSGVAFAIGLVRHHVFIIAQNIAHQRRRLFRFE